MNKKELYESIMMQVAKEVKKALNENVNAPHASEVANIDLFHSNFKHHMLVIDDNTGIATTYGFDTPEDIVEMFYSMDDHNYPEVDWIKEYIGKAGEIFVNDNGLMQIMLN